MDVYKNYFEWLTSFVYDDRYFKTRTFGRLLEQLYNTDFYYILPLDRNRAEDGLDLRRRFLMEFVCDPNYIVLPNEDPCSVLEMMVALAIRCEETIMMDDDVGNRTGQWFWTMVVNLGLGRMSDDTYDEGYVAEVLYNFLERNYALNGVGGLVVVENPRSDMREVEIWYQLSWYLSELIDQEV